MDDIRRGNCPLCRHLEIVRSKPKAFSGEISVSFRLAVAYRMSRGMFGTKGFSPNDPLGALLAYSCRACGFTQYFADGIAAVPIGADTGTELIRGHKADEGSTPYR